MADDQELNKMADAACAAEPSSDIPFFGFTGSYPYSIDTKNRLIIPPAFRKALGTRFAACPTPDFMFVALYPIEGWVKRRDELMQLVALDAEAQIYLDKFSKYSYLDCEMDAQGRTILPQKLRQWRLGDSKEVDVDGAMTHIRILRREDGDAMDEDFDLKHPNVLRDIAQIQQKQQKEKGE